MIEQATLYAFIYIHITDLYNLHSLRSRLKNEKQLIFTDLFRKRVSKSITIKKTIFNS